MVRRSSWAASFSRGAAAESTAISTPGGGDEEAAWQEEKRNDQEAFDAQSRGGELFRVSQEADVTFALKVCRGGVHAGGTEEVVVRSPDHTVSGLVGNICRRLKIPLDDGEDLVLSIGNGDMCRVVRSLDQLPQSCPVQLWRAGSGLLPYARM